MFIRCRSLHYKIYGAYGPLPQRIKRPIDSDSGDSGPWRRGWPVGSKIRSSKGCQSIHGPKHRFRSREQQSIKSWATLAASAGLIYRHRVLKQEVMVPSWQTRMRFRKRVCVKSRVHDLKFDAGPGFRPGSTADHLPELGSVHS
jgi:hypothetical protein